MHFQSALCAPMLVACLLACTSRTPGSPKGPQGQSDSPSTAAAPTAGDEDQIAQYPGAPYEDSKGNLWFSTVTQGIIRFDGKEFVTLGMAEGLAGQTVRGIQEAADGVLWIATNGGVSLFDGEAFRTLTDYGEIDVIRTFSKEGDHRDVWEILKDRSGVVWIATLDGVFRHDGTSFVRFPLPVESPKGAYEFAPRMVYSIFEDKKGRLWFGTDGSGAVCADGKAMTVYTVESHGLCSNRICTIFEDSRGDVWFGTSDGGVSRKAGKSFTTHLRSSTFSKHTGWGRFMAIHEDRAGGVWFGVSSAGGGVHRYDGKEFRHFSVEDGLGTGGVPSIRSDRKGNLWFGTTSGVFRFDGQRFIRLSK